MFMASGISIACHSPLLQNYEIKANPNGTSLSLGLRFSNCRISSSHYEIRFGVLMVKHEISVARPFLFKCFNKYSGEQVAISKANKKLVESFDKGVVYMKFRNMVKVGKKKQHLWKKRDSAGSGQKALNLVRIVSDLPNEKEAVYGELDKWIAWEIEFPLVAAAKALKILHKRSQWKHVAKWMLSKGQGATMGTYDTLLLAFDMDRRVDEAESLWNMILHTHKRSISKRLFSRIISLYDHHDMQEKIIEVFADMEELGVRPDEDTVQRVARAFQELGHEDKKKLLCRKYQCRWKYVHFKGERIRVRSES